MKKDRKIYVAGHGGLIGAPLVETLRKHGYDNLLTRTHREMDLTRQTEVEAFFEAERPEYVILNAAVNANSVNTRTNPVEVMLDNTLIYANIFYASLRYGVQKLLFAGTAGCYPSDVNAQQLPDGNRMVKEDAMQPGKIERLTERYYVMPKLLGTELCRTITENGAMKCVTLAITHTYGIHYHYNDPQRLPVFPALVKRFQDAARTGMPEVSVWGTGKLRRELTSARDIAEAYVLLLEQDDAEGIYNVGSGRYVSVREMAEAIAAASGYTGKIVFDPAKPEANEYPLLCTERLRALGWAPRMNFEDGVRAACDYYAAHFL